MSTALIVDDSNTDRQLVAKFLQTGGLNVIFAQNHEEAMEAVEKQSPDIIILDVVLPGRSGFEICRELKLGDRTKNIPVILCSTKGTEMDKFWGMKQGANAYLPKPLNENELLKTVSQLVA